MQVREKIILQLKKVVWEITDFEFSPQLSFPAEMQFGDYSTNAAMVVWGRLDKKRKESLQSIGVKNPMDLAERIQKELGIRNQELGFLKNIAVVKPGFINFWMSEQMLFDSLRNRLIYPDQSGRTDLMYGKKVMVEFTDPNPFKEFHIGHLYDNIVGESLARLLEAIGATVWRVTYQGDVGMHVAKSIYGMKEKLQDLNSSIEDFEALSLEARARFLGEAYALGARAFEEDEQAKGKIVDLNKKIYSKEDARINHLYEFGRKWSLEYFEKIYARLGSKFKKNYFESEAAPIGLALVKEQLQKGIFSESEGAVVFPKEVSGLHTRVFINSQGLPTYEAKELGLAPTKYKDFPYDLSIILTGNEVNEYFKVLLKALSLINPQLAEKTVHLSHGMVRLPEGKMSSRTGNVITGESLLNEATEKAVEKIQEVVKSSAGVGSEERREIAKVVGIGAVKYALLKSSVGKDVAFSFEESISFEGNAGPYLQYTYVRIQSVLAKMPDIVDKVHDLFMKDVANEEMDLLRWMLRFEDIVVEAAERYAPNVLCTYLFELAQFFNVFYQKCPILQAEDDVRTFRLDLVTGVSIVIKRGLEILGIDAPERM